MESTRRGFVQALLASPLLSRFVYSAEEKVVSELPPTSPRVIDWIPPSPIAEHRPLMYTLLSKPTREVLNARFDWLEHSQSDVCYNFAQIFRRPFGSAAREPEDKKLYDEVEWNLDEHYGEIEYVLFNGVRHQRTPSYGGPPQTFTGGIAFFAPHVAVGSDLLRYIDEHKELMKFGFGGWLAGRGHKLLFVPTKLAARLGVREGRFEHGRVSVIPTPSLDWDPKRAFLIDPEHIKLAKFAGRWLKLLETSEGHTKFLQLEYLSDVGLQVENPRAHTVFLL